MRFRLTGSLVLLVLVGACDSTRPAPPREFDGAAAMIGEKPLEDQEIGTAPSGKVASSSGGRR